MSSPTDDSFLADQAETILSKISAEFTGDSAFDRAYVSAGPPAADCSQLTVTVPSLTTSDRPTTPRSTPDRKHTVPVMLFRISFWRCTTETGEPPDEATLNAEGVSLMTDAWVVFRFLVNEITSGTLLEDLDCQHGKIRATTTFAAEGGLSGYTFEVEIPLG